jgi:hypothetical protein
MNVRRFLLVLLWLMLCPARAGAVVKRIYPLDQIIADADTVTALRVESLDAKAHVAVLGRTRLMKGKPAWTKLTVRLSGGDDARQLPMIEARLTRPRLVILFSKTDLFALGYVEGTWFRIVEPPHPEADPWVFVHLEPYLRRTFHGTSAQMDRIAVAVARGARKGPPPDLYVPPGYGDPAPAMHGRRPRGRRVSTARGRSVHLR